jgi:hypothetical protein
MIGGSLCALGASPVRAANDALDQTFQTPLALFGTTSINGEVNIPSLTAGSPVSGSGTMTIIWDGLTLYSGAFTATTLQSITPFGSGDHTFQPLPATVTTYTTNNVAGFPTYPIYNAVTSPASPVATTGLGVAVQIVPTSGPSVSPNQDLFLVCSNASSVLDVGITLTSPVSSAATQALASQPGSLLWSFEGVTGTSSGSLC